MEISQAALGVLGRLLESRSGQLLGRARHWRIEVSLRPLMAERGYATLDQLVAALAAPGAAPLADRVVDALLNNETFFFRDAAAFGVIEQRALARLADARASSRRLRIWSAGCSTGQEPYSLAMLIANNPGRWCGWHIDVMATDLSRGAISRARRGVYSQFEIQRGLAVGDMLRHFIQEGEDWRIRPETARLVRFHVHNIVDPAPGGPFDLILCRNLLFYLTPEMRRLAYARLAAAIAPDGALMLGAGETVIGNSEDFVSDFECRGLYRRRIHVVDSRVAGRVG